MHGRIFDNIEDAPQGTRIINEDLKASVQQQHRLAVVFHRAIMPDGYSVDFAR